MKKVVIFLLIAGGIFYWYRYRSPEGDAVTTFTNPVYAVVRMKFNVRGTSVERVVLVETKDKADCEIYAKKVENESTQGEFILQSSECKDALAPIYKILFKNQPTLVPYISIARSTPNLRETRIMYTDLPTEVRDQFCDKVLMEMRKRNLFGQCIRASKNL